MRRLLLESNVFLWWFTNPEELPSTVVDMIAQADESFVSVITPWELELKRGLGKLRLPQTLWDHLQSGEFAVADVTLADALRAARLPLHHRDPFDRMLVAQALNRRLALVTRDKALRAYGGSLIEA